MSRLSTSLRPCAHPIFPLSVLSVEALTVGLTTRRRRGKSESPPTTQGLKDGVDDGIRKTGGMTKSESAAFHHSLAVRCRRPTPDWLLIPTRFLFPTVSSVEGEILASNNTSACFSKISLESSPLTSFRQTFIEPLPPLGRLRLAVPWYAIPKPLSVSLVTPASLPRGGLLIRPIPSTLPCRSHRAGVDAGLLRLPVGFRIQSPESR